MKTHPVRLTAALLGLLSAAAAAAQTAPQTATWTPSPLPPPGVHPRLFFNADELPSLRARILDSDHGVVVRAHFDAARRDLPRLKQFADLPLSRPTPADLATYFKPDETRNIRWGLLALDAVVRDDAAQKQVIAAVIANYARLILASRELGATIPDGFTGSELQKRQDVWKNPGFNVGTAWLFGGSGLPVAYDLLYPDMTPDQRDVVRKALAAATQGRISWGMDFPKGRAFSNHYGYHGELAVMLAAIEGEEGYDKPTYDRITQVLTDYWDIGFTDDGACHEDSYGPNLGLRAGGMGLMVLAHRGHNVFATEKFRNYLRYLVYETQPFPGGSLVGGASGVGLNYPASIYLGRFTHPQDANAAYVYRYFLGADYRGTPAAQTQLEFALFGTDHAPAADDATKLGLPLSTFSPPRGKLIARSDWSNEALALHFDARPDAFAIGHDTAERGNISLSALGRSWTRLPSFRETEKSTDFSLVHIDGKAQMYKAPSVKFLSHGDSALAAGGAADLKYAYDWQWTPPWPKKDGKFPPPWEPEMSDPRALGWPTDPAWLPHKLFDEPGIGYEGSYLRRRPYNPVQKAFRSAMLVRGERPYVLIADDVRKDDAVHTYDWYLQVAPDLEIETQSGQSVVLKDPKSDRRLLVQALRADGFTGAKLETYTLTVDPYTKKDVPARRLILSSKSVEPKFVVMLYPYRASFPQPAVTATPGGFDLVIGGQKDQLTLTPDATGRSKVSLSRGGATHEIK